MKMMVGKNESHLIMTWKLHIHEYAQLREESTCQIREAFDAHYITDVYKHSMIFLVDVA